MPDAVADVRYDVCYEWRPVVDYSAWKLVSCRPRFVDWGHDGSHLTRDVDYYGSSDDPNDAYSSVVRPRTGNMDWGSAGHGPEYYGLK